MKTAVVIPIKTNNQRLPGKNTKLLGGNPLYSYMFNTLTKCKEIDNIYVDSSDKIILDIAKNYGFKIIKRPKYLNGNDISGNELINFELNYVKEDIFCHICVTTPFIKPKTIDNVILDLKNNDNITSIVPVYPIYNRFWFNNKSINHDFIKLVGTQYMEPIYCEVGFYIFKKESFLKEGSRITKDHKFFIIENLIECVDIDTELDFIYAESLIKKNGK